MSSFARLAREGAIGQKISQSKRQLANQLSVQADQCFWNCICPEWIQRYVERPILLQYSWFASCLLWEIF
jgi:hypothetical protein